MNILWSQSYEYNPRSLTDNYNKIGLTIITDKLTYKPGDKIHVSIYPKNIDVKITYENREISSRNSVVFEAGTENKILAKYGNEEYIRLINIISTNRLFFFTKLGFFVFLNYFFISLTKFSKIARWLNVV